MQKRLTDFRAEWQTTRLVLFRFYLLLRARIYLPFRRAGWFRRPTGGGAWVTKMGAVALFVTPAMAQGVTTAAREPRGVTAVIRTVQLTVTKNIPLCSQPSLRREGAPGSEEAQSRSLFFGEMT